MAGGDRTLKLSLLADTKNLIDGLNKGQKETQTFGDKIDSINKKVGLAFAAMGAAATTMALKFTKDAIGAASDMEETVSKIGVVFGNSAAEIEKFASTAARDIGQSKQQALDAAATFAVFGKSAGLSGQALVNFSTDFVKLASDLASFNNTTPEDAIMAIGAALRGEAEPLRRYGVLLDDATLKAAAMEMGIYSGSGALTAQQKVLAAQEVIMQQTSLAQGDFSRTSDGLANSQRQISAAVADAQAQLGEALLPVMLELSQFVEETLVPNLSAFISGLTGKGSMTEGLNESQKAAVEWGKKARMIFDALVALKGEIAVVAAALAAMWAVSKIQAAVMATIGFVNLLIKAYNALKSSAILAAVASRLALNPLLGAAASAAVFAAIGAAAKLADSFDTDAAQSQMSYNEQRAAAIAAGSAGSVASSIAGIASGGSFPSITGAVTGGSKTVTGAAGSTTDWGQAMLDATDTLTDAMKAQNESLKTLEALNRDIAIKVQGGTFQTTSTVGGGFNAGSFRAAEEASSAGITINVNAPTIMDESGFVRAVQTAIQQTQQRGTGGGAFAAQFE